MVSTVGRPQALEVFLASLTEEITDSVTVELIVVDQSHDSCCLAVLADSATTDETTTDGTSTDGTTTGETATELSWTYTRSAPGVSRGRNIGLSLARGDYVMFPDDDAWFSGTTLRQAVAHLDAHPEHDGLCTQLQDGTGRPSMLRWAATGRLVSKHNHHRTSIGSTMIFRTPVARSLDGFDELVGPGAEGWFGSCEDADFLLRFIGAGNLVWYAPHIVMNHRDSRLDGGPAAQHKALVYGCGQGNLWRKHRFPVWLVVVLAIRRTIGGHLWTLRGRPDIGRAHRAWVRGAANGWTGRMPVDMTAAEPAVVAGTHPPTEAEFGRSFSGRLAVAPLGTLATFVLTSIAARGMSSADVTIFYALLAALMIGPILGRFGLNQWAVRDLAALRTRLGPDVVATEARRLTISALAPAALAAPPIALVVVAGSSRGGAIDTRAMLLVTIILIAETIRLTVSDMLVGLGLTGWATATAHQVRSVVVTMTVGAYRLFGPDQLELHRLLELMAVIVVVLAILGIRRLWAVPARASEMRSRRTDVSELARLGFPFLVVDLVVVLVARGDVWLAGPIFTGERAAVYGTASVLAAQIGVPIGLASIAMAPVVAGQVALRRLDEVERSVRSLVTIVAWILVPVAALCVAAGRQLLGIVYGSPYEDAYPFFLMLLAGNVALALLGVSPVVLLMAGRHRDAMIVSASWFAVAAPTAVLVAIVFGPMGLAVASAATTIGLYGCLAVTTWVVTGVPVTPYLDPRRVRVALLLNLRLASRSRRVPS